MAWRSAAQSEHLPITFKGLSAGDFLTDLVTNGIPVVAFSMAGIALLAVLAWHELRGRRPDAPMRLFVLAMIALALALSAMVDLITLDGDIDRMNTVFKFYIHIWILLALAGAFGIWYVFAVLGWRPLRLATGQGGGRFDAASRRGWAVALVILVGGGLIYPISGTGSRVEHAPSGSPSTTATATTAWTTCSTPSTATSAARSISQYDYEAIQWMRQNVQGTPVIVEGADAQLSLGLPLLHLHRPADRHRLGLAPEAAARRVRLHGRPSGRRTLKNFYSSTDDQTLPTTSCASTACKYVIVGQLEQLYYPAEGSRQVRRHGRPRAATSSSRTHR